MTTTTTSDGDLAVRRDLFQGEDTAFARAGVFGEDDLKRLITIFPNASSVFEATKAGKSLKDLLQEPGTVDSSTRPPTEELDRVRTNLRITGKEIQVMAGAKFSSAINNWRTGKKGFPEPVVGGTQPLFDLTEVHAWLKGNDKLVNEPVADWYWRKWVQVLHRSVKQRGRFLRGYVTAMVFVLPDFPTEKDGWDDRLRDIHTPQGFDQWSAGKENIGEFVGFLRKHLLGMEFTGPEGSTRTSVARAFWYAFKNGFKERDLLDQALDTLTELSDTQDTTSLALSDLITRLVADLPGPPSSFLDLACGEATVLTNLINRGGLPDLKLSGFELEHETAAISMIRLGYHDNGADWDIQVRDSLAEGDSQTTGRPRGAFDAVLVDPPTKQFPHWTNRATALLNKTTASRAFVLLPESALAADGPCAGSIRRKQLEAAVCLPNHLKRKSRGLVLCVFTSDQATCEEILIVDLKRKDPDSETGTKPPGRIGDALPAADVCAAISHWRTTGTINGELLYGRQGSITADEAVERGLTQVVSETLFPGKPNFHVALDALPDIERGPHPEEVESDPWNLWDLSEEQIQQTLLAVVALLVRSSTDKPPITKQELEWKWKRLFEDDPAKQAQLANDPKLMVRVWRDLISANRSMWTTPADPIPFGPLAELSHVYLYGVGLREKDLGGANLSFANLRWADLRGALLVGALLTGADLVGANLGRANLEIADLVGTNLTGANLHQARLVGTDLSNADLSWAELARTTLAKANLTGANLTGANLLQANLNGADLSNADLSSANLQGASLYQANLSANLTGVNLSHAYLTGADLSRADLVRTVLNGATASPLTRWPDGFNPEAAKVIFED